MTIKGSNLISSHSEKPISFNGAMVRAILNGYKTQTRRVIKNAGIYDRLISHECCNQLEFKYLYKECPFGNPGDFLWVKETWAGPYVTDEEESRIQVDIDDFNFDDLETRDHCAYAADGAKPDFLRSDYLVNTWRPSIHMPRWASRILLQITDVHIEHLQSIGVNDIIKEGIKEEETDKIGKFIDLWERTGGTWIENPWVWVITFKRIDHPPIRKTLSSQPAKLKLVVSQS